MVIDIREVHWDITPALMRRDSWPKFGPLRFASAPPSAGADTLKRTVYLDSMHPVRMSRANSACIAEKNSNDGVCSERMTKQEIIATLEKNIYMREIGMIDPWRANEEFFGLTLQQAEELLERVRADDEETIRKMSELLELG